MPNVDQDRRDDAAKKLAEVHFEIEEESNPAPVSQIPQVRWTNAASPSSMSPAILNCPINSAGPFTTVLRPETVLNTTYEC